MKKLFVFLVISAGLVNIAQAQKLKAEKVPMAVRNAFTKLHPTAKVKWELEKKDYEAGFILGGKETTEVYSINGVLKETEVTIKLSEFPMAVMAKLKNLKITEAAKITRADGSVVYEAEVKGKDLLFDKDGKSIKN
ncbi:hypothetical protein EZJ43_09115 [Pedobacter changchengzhani]|uniref:Uncharacterized protein n=1 Tax=Pedobacter changchengzhani TaxID=2529274 RepID=A0A4R5MKB9_9SPHI|nr:hypothetical protein [Pedobacter changchengzhani]TDG36157.1 hypothetical protein EZJ43_09115 [Pedobacter changchengzhani]